MPVMSIGPLDFMEPHLRFLPTKLWAYMLFPTDGEKRDRFMTSALLEAASGAAKALKMGLEIRPSALGLLSNKADVAKMVDEAMVPVIAVAANKDGAAERCGGELAGELLLMAIAHDLQEPGSVSLNAVLAYASDYFRGQKGRGRETSVSFGMSIGRARLYGPRRCNGKS